MRRSEGIGVGRYLLVKILDLLSYKRCYDLKTGGGYLAYD